MPAIPGTVLAAKITPGDTAATFATHEDSYGQGGLRTVSTYEELTSIPPARQKAGMIVYVSGQDTYYKIQTTGTPLTTVQTNFTFGAASLSSVFQKIAVNTNLTSEHSVRIHGNVAVSVPIGGYQPIIFSTNSNGGIQEGQSTLALGMYSHAEGAGSQAIGGYSHAEGLNTRAGERSHAEGEATLASSAASHSEGVNTFASGIASHTEGWRTSTGEKVTFVSHLTGNTVSTFTFANNLSSKFDGVLAGTLIGGYGRNGFGGTNYFVLTVTARDTINGTISATPNTIGGYQLVSSSLNYLVNFSGSYAHAEGVNTTAAGYSSHAEGNNTTASGTASHAEGDNTTAFGYAAHTEGINASATGVGSHAEGRNTQAIGGYSHAAGLLAAANNFNSWIWRGSSSLPAGTISTTRDGQFMISAEGGSAFFGNVGINTDNKDNALTIVGNISGNNLRTSFGLGSATGDYSFAQGLAIAGGTYSHAEGLSTLAHGDFGSHSEGQQSIAWGGSSHSEGTGGISYGNASHVEGFECVAAGVNSHAEGRASITGETARYANYDASTKTFTFTPETSSLFNTVVAGMPLKALGGVVRRTFFVQARDTITGTITATNPVFTSNQTNGLIYSPTTTLGQYAHAEGDSSKAVGNASHAEGLGTIALGNNSHSEGRNTIAFGVGSHAAGNRAMAAHDYSYVWADGNQIFGSVIAASSTRVGQYMVSASGGMFVPGKMGIGIDCYSPGLSSNALTVVGTLSVAGPIEAQSSVIPVSVTNLATDRTFSSIDSNKIFHFDTTSNSLTAIFPSTLSEGFNAAIMNTGTNTLYISAGLAYKALGNKLVEQYAGAYVYKSGSHLFAVGGL
jgi:hypothetical protein